MTTQAQEHELQSRLAAIGARSIPEFEGVHEVWPRGDRLRAVRDAAATYKQRFTSQGQVTAVKSVDIASAPYPVKYGFNTAVAVPHMPLIPIINRMVLVQYEDWDGRPRTLAFEPTVPEGSAQAPFFSKLAKLTNKIPGANRVQKFIVNYYNEPDDVLAQLGLTSDDIDFCAFDHLHVQDPRMILGSTAVIPGERTAREPIFGKAKMLVNTRELATLQSLHPMQWAWYVEGSLEGVDMDSFATFEGDIELGPGVALLWPPATPTATPPSW